jgi:hypothetical protein
MYSSNDKIINGYAAVDGMRAGKKKNNYTKKTCSKCHFVHHKPHKTCPGIDPLSPRFEAGERCVKSEDSFPFVAATTQHLTRHNNLESVFLYQNLSHYIRFV